MTRVGLRNGGTVMASGPSALGSRGDLRPYQLEAVDAVMVSLLASPRKPQLLHIATAGGKTRVANEVVSRWYRTPILWTTKDWRLLEQAHDDLVQRHPVDRDRITRLGGQAGPLRDLPPATPAAMVVYTTLQTLNRRRALLSEMSPGLVVWDEAHWGEHAAIGTRLLAWCAEHGVPVLGLTGTPRAPAASRFEVAFSMDFPTLVREGWLAKPQLMQPIQTGVRWDPRRSGKLFDFRQDSLRELGRDVHRNELIVRHFAENVEKYGKTLIFACSIDHADELARLLTDRYGVPARAVHSRMSREENLVALRQFQAGEVRVLVNVAMLTHGIDLPDANSIFLARPTLSGILFAQMVGRGARRHEPSGKTTFNIVEFSDNLQRFGDQLSTGSRFFAGTNYAGTGQPQLVRRSVTGGHRFDPAGAPTWIPDQPGIPEAMRSSWYREGQTFAIRIELASRTPGPVQLDQAWYRGAEAMREGLERELPGRVAKRPRISCPSEPDACSRWSVVHNASCGWEVISPVLSGSAGYREVVAACKALVAVTADQNIGVNSRTGLHLRIGWRGQDLAETRRLIRLARLFEPAMATLVAPSRVVRFDGRRYDRAQPSRLALSTASVFPRRWLDNVRSEASLWERRRYRPSPYPTLHIASLTRDGSVEVRMMSASLNAFNILMWVSLWQQILWAAAHRKWIERVPDRSVLEPDGDIFILAQRYLPRVQQPRFLLRLHERRLAVLEYWKSRPELRRWARYAKHWTVTPELRRALERGLPPAGPTIARTTVHAPGVGLALATVPTAAAAPRPAPPMPVACSSMTSRSR